MDTDTRSLPQDPGLWSELLYMVENLELDCDSFSSSVKYGPAWTGCGHLVEERERAATCKVSVSRFTLDGPTMSRGSWTAPAALAARGGFGSVWSQEAAQKALRWEILEREMERERVHAFLGTFGLYGDSFGGMHDQYHVDSRVRMYMSRVNVHVPESASAVVGLGWVVGVAVRCWNARSADAVAVCSGLYDMIVDDGGVGGPRVRVLLWCLAVAPSLPAVDSLVGTCAVGHYDEQSVYLWVHVQPCGMQLLCEQCLFDMHFSVHLQGRLWPFEFQAGGQILPPGALSCP